MNAKSIIAMNFLECVRNRQLSIDSACAQTGLLEKLDTEGTRVVSQLLQNQAIQILFESQLNNSIYRRSDIIEDQQVKWGGIALPLVRRVYSESFAKEIVSTQPTLSPVSFIHYFDSDSILKQEYVTCKKRSVDSISELFQGYLNHHSLNRFPEIDTDIFGLLSAVISGVIDNEILQILVREARYSLNLSAKVSNILYSIQNISNQIKAKIIFEANFLVVSPNVHTFLFKKIPNWKPGSDNNLKLANGIRRDGIINGKFDVYVAPIMENTILLGYRGNNCWRTGAVFAPNVTLIRANQKFMTSYDFKVVRPEFYGKIVLQDLNTQTLL